MSIVRGDRHLERTLKKTNTLKLTCAQLLILLLAWTCCCFLSTLLNVVVMVFQNSYQRHVQASSLGIVSILFAKVIWNCNVWRLISVLLNVI